MCRHRKTWLINAVWEWCWQCGAIRELKRVAPNGSVPYTQWTLPVGEKGENPWNARKLTRYWAKQEYV